MGTAGKLPSSMTTGFHDEDDDDGLAGLSQEQKEALKEQWDSLSPEEKQQISDRWNRLPASQRARLRETWRGLDVRRQRALSDMETGLRSGRYGAPPGAGPYPIPAEASIEAVSALGAGHLIVAASVGAAALVDGALAAAAAVDASSHELSRMRHSEFLRPSGFYAARPCSAPGRPRSRGPNASGTRPRGGRTDHLNGE